jgi:hypothetical protein
MSCIRFSIGSWNSTVHASTAKDGCSSRLLDRDVHACYLCLIEPPRDDWIAMIVHNGDRYSGAAIDRLQFGRTRDYVGGRQCHGLFGLDVSHQSASVFDSERWTMPGSDAARESREISRFVPASWAISRCRK